MKGAAQTGASAPDHRGRARRLPTKRPDVLAWIGLIVLVAALAVLEVSLLDRRPLANDEATSYFIAYIDWSSFWDSVATSEANGSLFYLLLRFWLNVGRSEAVLRILPLSFAIATVPFMFAIARRMFGGLVALVAAALLSTNAMFLEHGQDLRSYSLSALLVTISSWFFTRGLVDPSRANRIGHVIASALAVYAHFFAALVLVAQVLTVLLFRERRRSLRLLAADMALVTLAVVPLAAFVFFGDRGQVDWIPELSAQGIRSALLDLSGMPSTPAMLLLAGLIGAGVTFAFLRQPPGATPDKAVDGDLGRVAPSWQIGFVLLWFVLPIAGAVAISVFKPLLISRYLLVALPGLALLTAAALTSLPWRLLVGAATAVVLVLAVVEVMAWYSADPETSYVAKASYVADHAGPDDGIVFYAPTVIRPFGYYAGYYDAGEKRVSPEVIYPDKYWLGYSRTQYDPPVERITEAAATHDRVWLVSGAARDDPRVVEHRALVGALGKTCTRSIQPLVGLRLFTGCAG